MKYRYTGDVEQYFPTLGRLLKPGQTVDLDLKVSSPYLEPVKPKTEPTKVAESAKPDAPVKKEDR